MQASLDVRKGVVSWKVMKGWAERVVKEGWKMMVYMSNQGVPGARKMLRMACANY